MGVAQQPQAQPQAAPQTPTSANILIQKKEQKSLLLESVIDFASLVFHCVGSAITNKGGVLRTQQKQREIIFKYTLSYLSSVFGSSSNTLFVIALALLVIPAVEVVWLVGLKNSKRCAICTIYPHTTLTL